MEGEQEYFMRLDAFVRKFGQPPREKIATWLEFNLLTATHMSQ